MFNTRKEIEEQFSVNEHGVITSPGRFEGEMVYVPYFWGCWMDGQWDFTDRDTEISGFKLKLPDKVAFPELKGRRTVKIWQDDQGFVREVR